MGFNLGHMDEGEGRHANEPLSRDLCGEQSPILMSQGIRRGAYPQRLRLLSRRNQYIDVKLLEHSLTLLPASQVASDFRLSLSRSHHSDTPVPFWLRETSFARV